MRSVRILLWLLIAVAMSGGCTRDDETGAHESTVPLGIDFLMFPNPQASLGVGDYDVVADNASGAPINYTLTIVSTDGSRKTVSGTLAIASNVTLTSFAQKIAGGVTITLNTGGALARLRLCGTGTSCTTSTYIAASPIDQVTTPGTSVANPTIDLPRHGIDSVTYATEYYRAIDPDNERITLADFKNKNGFGANCAPNGATEFEVRFRDVLDLGYGRHMCARGDTTAVGDVAFWVENFQVTAVPGVKYGPLNLEAVVTDDRRWHIGTNAIEYSPNPNGSGRIAKFYTFNPDGTRRLLVDLDGRGAKAMPNPCISCHGGRAPPLLHDATTVLGAVGFVSSRFPDMPNVPRGGTLARLQPLNVDTLDFAPNAPYRRVDQEASLKALNRLVLCTYPNTGDVGTEDACRDAAANSEWQGTNAAMIKAWYGGTNLPDTTQSDTFIPSTGGVPDWAAGAEQNIYRTVVAPNCRVCHSLRGNANQSDIDFTSYTKFSGYADQIKHHVYDKGNMPLALLKFDHFWESSAPSTLASIIPGSTTGGGSVLDPSRPVAQAGPDRVVRPGTTMLSGAESTNATSFSWSVTAGTCSFAVGENTKIRPSLTTSGDGTSCTIRLVVRSGSTSSDPDSVLVVISNAAPVSVTFSTIRNSILRGAPGCFGCHNPAGGFSQIPLYYADDIDYDGDGAIHDEDGVDGGGTDNGDLHQLYLNVRARINFADIENSPLLRKPTGNHHCGGDLFGIGVLLPGDPDPSRVLYDTLLNWILAGAPE